MTQGSKLHFNFLLISLITSKDIVECLQQKWIWDSLGKEKKIMSSILACFKLRDIQ